jgi:hypothetical protein
MSNLYFQVDASMFENVLEEFRNDLQKDLNEAIKHLTDITLEKTLEFAEQGLKTTFEVYKDNLSSRQESAGVYIISLKQKALWIEEGLPPEFDLKPGILNGKNAKMNAEGHKYAVVPFKHNKGPSQNTPKAQELVDQVKSVLRQENISFGKIEKHANGSPRFGLLHKIDIDSDKPTAKASTGALQGISIYQRGGFDKKGQAEVQRGIYTFRTVTDGPASKDKWIHPGTEAKKFMDKALEWAEDHFEREILPMILDKWK